MRECVVNTFIFKECYDGQQLEVTTICAGSNEHGLLIDETTTNIEKCLPKRIDADFVWALEKLAERAFSTSVNSVYFNLREEQYKLRLNCGWRQNYGKDVNVYLCIYPQESNTDLQWPFDRHVTITITNPQSPNVVRAVTKQCRIAKPPFNLFYKYQWSDPFTFSYNDLAHAGLLLNNNMIVNGFIDDQ